MKQIYITLSITVFFFVHLSACQSSHDKMLLDKLKTREAAREQLLKNPGAYITVNTWDIFDKGIVNEYSKVTSITLTNKSILEVDEVSGTVSYLNADGSLIAIVPFKTAGTIRAGQTTKVNVTAGEVSGRAKNAKFRIEGVHIIGQ